MGIELKKESLSLSQLRASDTAQILVEGDVIVPDVKPDIQTVLQADASAVVTGKEKADGKLCIRGTIFLKILYIPESAAQGTAAIKSISTKFDFTDELPLSDEDTFIDISAMADQVEYTLIHSRKMNFKILVSLCCRSYAQRSVDFVTGVDADCAMELRRQKVGLYNVKSADTVEFVVEESLDVPNGKPDIGDILKVDVKIDKGECKIMNGKAMLKGNVCLCTLYVSEMEGQGIEFMEHEIPFSEVVDLPSLNEGNLCDVRYDVKDIYYTVKDDLNGDPRLLGVELLICCAVMVSETRQLDVVRDCYAPSGETKLDTQRVQLEELLGDDVSQMTLKQLVAIPAGQPSVDGVYNVIAQPVITGKSVEDGCLIIEGSASVYILYVSSDAQSPLCSYREEVPFRHSVRMDGIQPDMTCDVSVSVEHTSFSLNMASEVEVRCILEFSSKVVRSYPMELITGCEIEERAETQKAPSLIIYFAQQDDCMWDVAKRYHTTMDKIRCANKMEEDADLCAGQKVLIPRR